MSISNQLSAEAFATQLRINQDEVSARGQAFTEGFLGLQALQGAALSKGIADVQSLAEPVVGQPVRGVRRPFHYFIGEEEPETAHARPVQSLSFFGILHGVEAVKPPGKSKKAADLLCLVVDPLTVSDDPAIRDATYHAERGWRTYLYQPGAIAYAEQRLWVPASGISEVTIDAGYFREALLDVVLAKSEDQITRVRELFPQVEEQAAVREA